MDKSDNLLKWLIRMCKGGPWELPKQRRSLLTDLSENGNFTEECDEEQNRVIAVLIRKINFLEAKLQGKTLNNL